MFILSLKAFDWKDKKQLEMLEKKKNILVIANSNENKKQ